MDTFDRLTDDALNTIFRLNSRAVSLLKQGPIKQYFRNRGEFLESKLLKRVPVSHLWEVEKLQRDLNIPTL
jgi:hypothetical protein